MHSLSSILLHDFFHQISITGKKRRLPVCNSKERKKKTKNSPFKEKLNKMK